MKTDAPFVLTIFGGERCVVSLEDLEAAAKAIHQKAVRESETRANPSTFPAEIEGQIRVLNAQSGPSETGGSMAMNVPPLITYPARPIQGGRLELAPPKRGLWYAEPKFNGWRALIHTPTGTMWNRHGALLTIADCFRPALRASAKLAGRGLVWADCEALERRHNLGRSTLVVLDVVPESGTPSYEQRRALLESLVASSVTGVRSSGRGFAWVPLCSLWGGAGRSRRVWPLSA